MNADWNIFDVCWMRLLAGLVMSATAFAQSEPVSPQTSVASTAPATYEQEQQTLAHQWQTLLASGATDQQLEAWRLQNAVQFEAQHQLARQQAQAFELQAKPIIQEVTAPGDASSTARDFLVAQTTLANARAQIHNQLLQTLPANPTSADIDAMGRQEEQTFIQQHASDLQLQAQRSQTLATEAASSRPLLVPGPPVIPPNATPQLKAFLTARNALAADRAQLWNQYLTADPAVRQAAMEGWEQQNAARMQQLQQLAQAMVNAAASQ